MKNKIREFLLEYIPVVGGILFLALPILGIITCFVDNMQLMFRIMFGILSVIVLLCMIELSIKN